MSPSQRCRAARREAAADRGPAEGPAHAYLLHGPAGTGKRQAADAFAGALLGDERRVVEGMHPDLYVLEALGEMIRIDAVRELRRDLHMRPFEADRRVYLDPLRAPPERGRGRRAAQGSRGAAALRRDRARRRRARPAAGDDPLALPARAVPAAVGEGGAGVALGRAPGLSPRRGTALARVASGRLDRARRLLEPEAVEARRAAARGRPRGLRRSGVRARATRPQVVLAAARARGARAKEPRPRRRSSASS